MVRVMVVFGGRSGEHEVSLASARAITEALGKSGRHEVVPVGITREGRWISSGEPMRELESMAGYQPDGSNPDISGPPASTSEKLPAGLGAVDVVFPVLHGPYGEDGTIQGMLELTGVPYVGSGVLGSAAGMDKPTMKKIFAHHNLPQVAWVAFTRKQWEKSRETWTVEIEDSLGYPCFVKPANLGSSVGIRKAENAEELGDAIDEAARLDRRIIVEEGIDAREIEVSVLGNEDVERHLGELEQRLQDWLLFIEGQMDDGANREEISEELKAKGDAEMLAEGADTAQSEHYGMAGSYPMLTDGLMRYATRRREKS